MTRRKELTKLLEQKRCSTYELASLFDISEREIEGDLRHIAISQRHKDPLIIFPARCLSCDYVFSNRKKISAPSRCPKCKSIHLSKPNYQIKIKKKRKK